MEAKVENTNEKLIKEIRTKLATLSTNTLLRYYEDIKSKIIPQIYHIILNIYHMKNY